MRHVDAAHAGGGGWARSPSTAGALDVHDRGLDRRFASWRDELRPQGRGRPGGPRRRAGRGCRCSLERGRQLAEGDRQGHARARAERASRREGPDGRRARRRARPATWPRPRSARPTAGVGDPARAAGARRRPRARALRLAGTSCSRARGAASPASAEQLPRLAELGFDVLYLPPIHPIGTHEPQGPQQLARRRPRRPRQPVGDRRDATAATTRVHPELGTLDDFDALVADGAGEHGVEIASTSRSSARADHPWLTEHPEWFHRRPDGT